LCNYSTIFQEEFGGHGFSHILTKAVPKMTSEKMITQAQIDKILIKNPAMALALPK
jgi:predicted metal-dependent phosphotriesterase family hydrolase